MSENYHRGKEEGMSLYYAKECKAQQGYYRDLSDKELLEEVKSSHYLNNGLTQKQKDGYVKQALNKAQKDKNFYNLTARAFNFLDKNAKPRATAVRKNVQFLDDTIDEVKEQLEIEVEYHIYPYYPCKQPD